MIAHKSTARAAGGTPAGENVGHVDPPGAYIARADVREGTRFGSALPAFRDGPSAKDGRRRATRSIRPPLRQCCYCARRPGRHWLARQPRSRKSGDEHLARAVIGRAALDDDHLEWITRSDPRPTPRSRRYGFACCTAGRPPTNPVRPMDASLHSSASFLLRLLVDAQPERRPRRPPRPPAATGVGSPTTS